MSENPQEVQWLEACQQQAWRHYLMGSALLTEALNEELSQHGLTLQEYEVMVRLSEAPDHRLRMSTLAASLVHSRSRVTHTVARMERRGLVRRLPSEVDRRGVDCMLETKGYELLVAAAPGHVTQVRTAFVDVLTDAELKTIGAAFARVAEARGYPVAEFEPPIATNQTQE